MQEDMEDYQFSEYAGMGQEAGPQQGDYPNFRVNENGTTPFDAHPINAQQGIILAELSPAELTADMVESSPPRRRVWLPLALFIATCVSTVYVGGCEFDGGGWKFAAALMTILIFHEMGHFLQARRYGVHSSFPYFIPMPFSPFGTFGAVIGMSSRMGDRKALFDIGITGPLAGLAPTLICCVLGIYWSKPVPAIPLIFQSGVVPPSLGEPLLFQWMSLWIHGPIPAHFNLMLGPIAYAGWVGLFITALNLFPIGQLDGGHVLYALLRTKAHAVATILLVAAAVVVVLQIHLLGGWMLMIFLLTMMGPRHPPTANDDVPLGLGRIILGWLTLAFLLIGFTPWPFLP